jgi:hypothetical protein
MERKNPDAARWLSPDDYRSLAVELYNAGYLVLSEASKEWSVRYPDGFVDGARFTRAGAERRAAELDGEVVGRIVGPWATPS